MNTTLERGEKKKPLKGSIDTDKVVSLPLNW